MITDEEIEQHRVSGDITLILKHGEEWEVQSLLSCIEHLCGLEERQRLEEWRNSGMTNA
jgi:transcriptional regulator of NAD metabolism